MKKKIVISLVVIISILFISGITYSKYTSNASLAVTNQFLAKFIFDAEETDSISLPMTSLNPGDEESYTFSVTNNKDNKRSNVDIEYSIRLETFHFMPLDIKLYKVLDDKEELVLNCDESYSRDDENKLICNSSPLTLSYSEDVKDDYKLVVSFSEEYNSLEYTDLVDYIDISIKSYQKTD